MGLLSAKLFEQVQAAAFYQQAHQAAIALVGAKGKTWFDIGTGPGLLARLAAKEGAWVTAVDQDEAMLKMAAAHQEATLLKGGYLCRSLAALVAEGRQAEIVSAASLLAVLPDRRQGIMDLLRCVAPGGSLLLIETTEQMHPRQAVTWLWRQGIQRGNVWLLIWAWVRRGRKILSAEDFDSMNLNVRFTALLDGMLGVWEIQVPQKVR